MADADRDRKVETLTAEVMWLTEKLGQRQSEVKDLADRRKAAMRALLELNVPKAEIARMANVSRQQVQQLVRNPEA